MAGCSSSENDKASESSRVHAEEKVKDHQDKEGTVSFKKDVAYQKSDKGQPIEEYEVWNKKAYKSLNDWVGKISKEINAEAPDYYSSQQQYEVGRAIAIYNYAKHYESKMIEKLPNHQVTKQITKVKNLSHDVLNESETDNHSGEVEKLKQAIDTLKNTLQ